MNPDQEDFDALRKLLALKKYEQPPPRYFSDLPANIWARIEREPAPVPFWERFLPNLGINPTLAYSFGLLACGTLVLGIGHSLTKESTQTAVQPIAEDIWGGAPKVAGTEASGLGFSNLQATQVASTNPVMNSQPLPSLFGNPQLQTTPVSFSPGQ